MAISNQPSFFTDEQTQFFNDVTRGITGPPDGVFPYMPNRTQWNRDWPLLHTIVAAVHHIIGEASEAETPMSAPMVRQKLIDMGFGEHDVHHTISSILGSSKHRFVKVIRRDIPEDGGKSWAMYVDDEWTAHEVNAKDTALVMWLMEHADRLDGVQRNVERYGAGRWTERPIHTTPRK